MSSNFYQNDNCRSFKTDFNNSKRDCCQDGGKHPDVKGVILVCGKRFNETIEDVEVDDLPTNPIVLARVTIDTACLCKPIVKIDFSTILQISTDDTPSIVLVFALVRTCNSTREILERYRLKFKAFPGFAQIEEEERIFAFTFCDDEFSCHRDCCFYTVELISATGTEDNDLRQFENRNTAINAIAQGLCD